jgi:hypothetical protein
MSLRLRSGTTLAVGLVLTALLAACGGGGAGTRATPLGAAPTSTPLGSPASTARITLTIPQSGTQSHPGKPSASLRHAAAAGKRTPKYIDSNDTEGLQIIATAGSSTQGVYVDVSGSSPVSVCTTTDGVETCTIAVPVLAASETLTVAAVDVKPTSEGTNGNPPGYGSGFTGAQVLSAGTTTATLVAGQTTPVSLVLGPVMANVFDCGYEIVANASIDYASEDDAVGTGLQAGNYPADRIVFTQGTAGSLYQAPSTTDYGEDAPVWSSPAPAFVDVNGAPEALTVTSSLQHVGLYAVPGTPSNDFPTPGPSYTYTPTVSFPDYSWAWLFEGYSNVMAISYDGSASAGGVIVATNNLSATTSLVATPYTTTMTYNVAFVGASPTALTLQTSVLATNHTGTVTGTDFEAAHEGIEAGSLAGSGNGDCKSSGAVTLATIVAGTMNTTTWTQTFTVTATTVGTCTFYLSDTITGRPSQQVTVTIPD